MIKRTIEISRQASHLSVRDSQLVVQPVDQPKDAATRIPCEDIGVVLVDHPAVSYTHQALAKLAEAGAAVVICGRDHLPAGILLPMPTHTQIVWRINEQINASKPTQKRLWQQIVIAKIRAQAANVILNPVAHRKLLNLTRRVRSGDTSNVEAQAAKVYWQAWRPDGSPGAPGFRRDPNGTDHANAMLNYGYSALRAAVGRCLVSAGLFPALGIHHSNRSNAFCLADDLVEPLRPMVDRRVRSLLLEGANELTQPVKAKLLQLLAERVEMTHGDDAGGGPLMVALHRYAASFARCLTGPAPGEPPLNVPVMCEPTDDAVHRPRRRVAGNGQKC